MDGSQDWSRTIHKEEASSKLYRRAAVTPISLVGGKGLGAPLEAGISRLFNQPCIVRLKWFSPDLVLLSYTNANDIWYMIYQFHYNCIFISYMFYCRVLDLPRQLGRGRLDASPAPRKNSRAHTIQPSRSRPPSADPAGRVVGKTTHALVTWLVEKESHGNLVSSVARLEEQDLLGF